MFFNSFQFLFFLPIVFAIYWSLNKKSLRLQNLLLLLSSYYFYSCWDWRFLFLLIFSTLLDYYAGIKMHESKNLSIKKAWFCVCVVINLGFLSIFKYYDFFAISLQETLSKIGLVINVLLIFDVF